MDDDPQSEWHNISPDDTETFPAFETDPDFALPEPMQRHADSASLSALTDPDFKNFDPRNATAFQVISHTTTRLSTQLSTSSTACQADSNTSYFQALSPPRISSASLHKLKDWIDHPPPFAQKSKTSPVYLFKAEFTFAVLMEGLIYVVGKYKRLASEFRTLASIASNQYHQDMDGWLEEYGLDVGPGGICLRAEIESQWWELELRNAFLKDEERFLLPRTIGIFARLVEKLEASNWNLKYGVAALQGDVEVEGLLEEDEDE